MKVLGVAPDAVKKLGMLPQQFQLFLFGSLVLLFHEDPRVIKNAAANHRPIQFKLGALGASFFYGSKIAVSEDGQIQSFDFDEWKKNFQNRNDRAYSYKNALYLKHECSMSQANPDQDQLIPSNMLVAVGTQKDCCASMRIFRDDEMKADIPIRDNIEWTEEALSFTDIVKVVSADNLIENLVIGSNRGCVQVYGLAPRFLREDPQYRYGEIVAHCGEVSALATSIDGKYVFSAGKDGIIFMYDVVEYTP